MEAQSKRKDDSMTQEVINRIQCKFHNIFLCGRGSKEFKLWSNVHHVGLDDEINAAFSQKSRYSAAFWKKIGNITSFFFIENMACYPVFISSLILLFLCVIIKLEDRVTEGPSGALKSRL